MSTKTSIIEIVHGEGYGDSGLLFAINNALKGMYMRANRVLESSKSEREEPVPSNDYPPHVQRVIDEKKELDLKIRKLVDFIGFNELFDTLHPEDQELMREQQEYMHLYSETLSKRLERMQGKV